ncbi:unnamed protein product, partial [Medioppia subpectinata]
MTLLSDDLKFESVVNYLTFNQLFFICPTNPEDMNAKLLLFTRDSNNGHISEILVYNTTVEDIAKTNFSINRKTVVITHGWTDYYGKDLWMPNMKDYFLDYDYNVVVLDWETPASDSNYFNAAFNCQIVGAMLSYFVRTLVSMGVNVADIHLVGHSLGAHIVGFCGKNFTNPKIGRISGLDPAGPGFWRNDSRTRLAPTDASLVVVTHTSGGLIKWDGSLADVLQMSGYVGNVEPLGHYDFRPNGGTGQPGCNRSVTTFITNRFKAKANESRNCNHNRATVLPIADRELKEAESCQLIAYECDSYDNFYSGKCGDCGTDGQRCRPLEFNLEYWLNDDNVNPVNALKTFPNNYYLLTANKQPFCLFHYQIVIYVKENSILGKVAVKLGHNKT